MEKFNYIFKALVGSQAYGTSTPQSDRDVKGVYMQHPDDILSFKYQEKIEITKDEFYFEVRRFLGLLKEANPTCLEMLWMPSDCIIEKKPVFDLIIANRDKFLTQQCYNSFGRYAESQIKKAKGLNKKMNWENSRVERKTPLDFCYVYENGKTKKVEKYLEERKLNQKLCGLVALDHFKDCYSLYYDLDIIEPKGYHGIVFEDSNDVRLSSVPKGLEPETIMIFNKDHYSKHCKDYREYQEWLEKRNTQRYVDNIGHNQKIDCYLEKETEFLTKLGWKKYDEITKKDKIASVNKEGTITFDNYLDRHKSSYSGKIYTYENRYSRFSVTPNHNLFLQYLSRSIKNNFQTKIDIKNLNNFEYITVEDFFSKRKNYSKILHTPLKPLNSKNEYDLTDEEIKILGGYISDGCLTKYKQIAIDQKKGKNLFDFLNKSSYFNKSEYTGSLTGLKYFRFKYKNIRLYNFIKKNIGEGSLNKFLSNEFFKFSKRQVDILVEYMVRGDGHKHHKGHSIYYTSSKELAKDLQTLLFVNGLSSQIYTVNHKGGFENSSSIKYQVQICKNNKPFGYFNKKFNWEIKNKKNVNICCFTTKHGNLITRNKNKISIQGNSKNILHCRRLLDVAIEIATDKTIRVRRPNADYLLSIRRGEVSLEEIIDNAEKDLAGLEELYLKSGLPKECDAEFVNDLLVQIRNFK